jgi:catechol 2,3-dioxygenase
MGRLGEEDAMVAAPRRREGCLGARRAPADDDQVVGAHPEQYRRVTEPNLEPIDPRVRIGHVHLKVADLDRALAFYCGILGFQLMTRLGRQAAFISAGGYHHHIGLNTWESAGGSPPPPGSTGLYHHAILYPDRRTLGQALRRLLDAGWPITGASDHGVELYRDRPSDEWPRSASGELALTSEYLDLGQLLAEAEAPTGDRA